MECTCVQCVIGISGITNAYDDDGDCVYFTIAVQSSLAACHAERIKFRLAVTVPLPQHDSACIPDKRLIQWATDDDSRKRLRSASSHKLIVQRSRLTTYSW